MLSSAETSLNRLSIVLIDGCHLPHTLILLHQYVELAKDSTFASISRLNRLQHLSNRLFTLVLPMLSILVVGLLKLSHRNISSHVDAAVSWSIFSPHSYENLLFKESAVCVYPWCSMTKNQVKMAAHPRRIIRLWHFSW